MAGGNKDKGDGDKASPASAENSPGLIHLHCLASSPSAGSEIGAKPAVPLCGLSSAPSCCCSGGRMQAPASEDSIGLSIARSNSMERTADGRTRALLGGSRSIAVHRPTVDINIR